MAIYAITAVPCRFYRLIAVMYYIHDILDDFFDDMVVLLFHIQVNLYGKISDRLVSVKLQHLNWLCSLVYVKFMFLLLRYFSHTFQDLLPILLVR